MFASVQISSVLLTRAIHPLCELGVRVSCLRNKRERETERGQNIHTINKA